MSDSVVETQTMLDKLWHEFDKTNDLEIKNRLIMNYLVLVKKVVSRMMPTYNSYFEFDDLLSVGIFGLVEAIERFDIGKNIKFETYAIKRIRGKVLDYMRNQDWASVSLRKRIKEISNAFVTLEMQKGRSVSEEEVAEYLNLDVEKIRSVLYQTYIFNSVYFESLISQEEPGSAQDVFSLQSGDTVGDTIEKEELSKLLSELIIDLPANERRVIELYYFEEMLLKEISLVLNLSESRISQIHSKVLAKLRVQIERKYYND